MQDSDKPIIIREGREHGVSCQQGNYTKVKNNPRKDIYKIKLLPAKSYHKHLGVAYDRHCHMVHKMFLYQSKLDSGRKRKWVRGFLIWLILSARECLYSRFLPRSDA